MENGTLSSIFGQMADVMEILGEDRFRVNSYRTASRVISEMPADAAGLLESGALAETPGIGKSTLAKISTTLLELLSIPGIGPKTVETFYHEPHIQSIADLKQALDDGLVETLPGFGPKKAAAIRKGIEFLAKSTGRIGLDRAIAAAQVVVAWLQQLPGVERVQPAGSVRRRAGLGHEGRCPQHVVPGKA
jgi:DNA polymerase (family 10)